MTNVKLTISDYIEIYVTKKFTFKLAEYVITASADFLILNNDNKACFDIQDCNIISIAKDSVIVDVDYMNAYNELFNIETRYTLSDICNELCSISTIAEIIAKTLTIKELLTNTKISYTGRCITYKNIRKQYSVILDASNITHCATDYDFYARVNDSLEIRNQYYTTIHIDEFSLSFSSQDTQLTFNNKEIEYNVFQGSFIDSFAPNYKKVYALDILSDAFRNDYIEIPDDTLTHYVKKSDIVKTFKANKFIMSLD